MPFSLWASRSEHDVCMKRIIKITLAIFLLLGLVGFIFAAYSISGWLTEFDDAFLFIEGQEGFVLSQSEFEKNLKASTQMGLGR